MPLDLQLERRADGGRRAHLPECLQALSEFLEADLQGSLSWCDDVLKHIDAVATGSLDQWQRSGNACYLTLGQCEAKIEHHYSVGVTCVLPISEFREAVLRWREFVEHEKRAV